MLNTTTLLHEHLTLTAGKNATGEPIVSLVAAQLFFGLSRVQVREFYHLLLDVGAALYSLCPASTRATRGAGEENDDEVEENIYEAAKVMLHTKVRFVPRDLHQEPVAMLGLETLHCELTHDELIMLDQEVFMQLYDIEMDEATWFSAYEHFTGDRRHLMDKEHYDRRGAVLCGSRPVLREGSSLHGWFLQPLDTGKELDAQRVCPLCLALWKAQQTHETCNIEGSTLFEKEQP